MYPVKPFLLAVMLFTVVKAEVGRFCVCNDLTTKDACTATNSNGGDYCEGTNACWMNGRDHDKSFKSSCNGATGASCYDVQDPAKYCFPRKEPAP